MPISKLARRTAIAWQGSSRNPLGTRPGHRKRAYTSCPVFHRRPRRATKVGTQLECDVNQGETRLGTGIAKTRLAVCAKASGCTQEQLCTVLVANSGQARPFDLKCELLDAHGGHRQAKCLHSPDGGALSGATSQAETEPYGSAASTSGFRVNAWRTPVGYWQIF